MDKPESQSKKIKMTPLLLIAAFLSLTEIIAGATIAQTTGNIQFMLVAFVILFPILISAAFFYILVFRNYVLFAPHEYDGETNISEYVEAMNKNKEYNAGGEYDKVAHAIFGILDSMNQELPEVIEKIPSNQENLTIQADVLDYSKRYMKYKFKDKLAFAKITVGSIKRKDATIKFPFLSDKLTRIETKRATQNLSSNDYNCFFKIKPDGNIHTILDIKNCSEIYKSKENINLNDFLFVQIIEMVHEQLIVVFYRVDEIAFPSLKGKQLIEGIKKVGLSIHKDTLVISDEGDIYGNLIDIANRNNHEI